MSKILICVDCQNDFIDGSLAVPGAKERMDRLAEYISSHVNDYELFIFTRDSHPKNHCSFVENGGKWPKHCVQGTYGEDIYEPIVVAMNDIYNHRTMSAIEIITKGEDPDEEEYSAFGNLNDEYKPTLKNKDIDVCGIVGEVCVMNSIKDLRHLTKDSQITALIDLTACFDREDCINKYQKEFPEVNIK